MSSLIGCTVQEISSVKLDRLYCLQEMPSVMLDRLYCLQEMSTRKTSLVLFRDSMDKVLKLQRANTGIRTINKILTSVSTCNNFS